MVLFGLCIVIGLALLVWSADKFIDGSVNVARYYGIPPLIIGMVIVGFGTSAPELVVSAISAYQKSPGIALGNAYGSNITNIALILGLTSMLMPISVHSQVLRRELPVLSALTFVSIGLLYDLTLSRSDAFVLLVIFSLLFAWTIREGRTNRSDAFSEEMESELKTQRVTLKKSILNLLGGLALLVLSSRALVYGAVGIAKALGVTDIIVGLTVVAVGTSLPELASSIVAARKGEPDIALGNILGSNLFNTLVVVGIAGLIHPMQIEKEILYRDISVMTILTVSLFLFGYGFKGKGRINRFEGTILFVSYLGYIGYLISDALKTQ